MKWISFDLLLNAASKSTVRFPFVVLCAVFASLLGVYQVEQVEKDLDYFLAKMTQVAILGLALFLAADLYAQRNLKEGTQKLQLRLIVLAFLVAYFFTLPTENNFNFVAVFRYGLWLLSFHLLVAFSPYLWRKELNGFWQFNQVLFIRLILGALYSAFLFFGICIALVAIDQLFGAEISYKVYIELWILITGVFNTLFFLAGVPEDFDALDSSDVYFDGLKLFTQYVLLPLVTLYLMILYVYSGKILIEWNLPKGWVSILVIAFSVAGVFSLLLIYPIEDDEENKWIKIFRKWFYRALLPLVILLFAAIGKRITDYGITEERYYVVLIAFWLAGIAIYFLISRSKNIKVIPISLFLVTFFSSFGPWGAFYISEKSQLARLDYLFVKNKMLEAGKLSAKSKTIQLKQEDADQIASIISFLSERKSLPEMQRYFKADLDTLFRNSKDSYELERKVLALINDNQLSTPIGSINYEKSENYTAATQDAIIESIKGFDYRVNLSYFNNTEKEKKFELNDKQTIWVDLSSNTNKLRIFDDKVKKNLLLEFDLNPLLKKLRKRKNSEIYNIPPAEMTLLQESTGYKAKLQLNSIYLNFRSDDTFYTSSISGVLFLRF